MGQPRRPSVTAITTVCPARRGARVVPPVPDNTATELAAQAAAALERLRQAAPLVHNITNVVVANVTANALLAAGASPAMVQAEEEVADFAPRAAALVVNTNEELMIARETLRVLSQAALGQEEVGREGLGQVGATETAHAE